MMSAATPAPKCSWLATAACWKTAARALAAVLLLAHFAANAAVRSEVAPLEPEREAANKLLGIRDDDAFGRQPPIGAAGTAVRSGDSDISAIGASINDHLSRGNSSKSTSGNSSGGANFGFTHSFIATLSVIVVSELGDKTFFIAAIMAMRHSRLTVFAGAMAALALMHVMSAFFGYAITVIPRVLTYYISSFLFAVFGLKMLRDGYKMSPNEGQEEMEEVQEDLRKREIDSGGDLEAGIKSAKDRGNESALWSLVSKIFLQAFTMTFLAEWGDRSQLATIVLAAREEITGVIVGGVLGHTLCTGLAVLGGRIIAQRISVRTVTIVGGAVFLLFAVTALFMDPNEG